MKKAIIGAGGFGKEVYHQILDNYPFEKITFFADDQYAQDNILPLSKFDPEKYEVVVAIGDPSTREKVVNNLPKNTKFFKFIHNSVLILSDDIFIGEGSIICPGSILTCNIKIGKHSHLNLHTTIGHDCIIGDYLTTAPGANISGKCTIGNRVYIGTNSSIRERTNICDDVTIGLNSGVVKHITDSGVYGGTPIKKLKDWFK